MNELLKKSFTWPDLSDRRVLVVGLGGGCDIISAYAVARMLRASHPAEVVYGNTKRQDDGKLEYVSEHVRHVSSWQPESIMDDLAYGTTAIDHMIPRGDRGCPFIFLISTLPSASSLADEIRQLEFDFLVGVDTGGDSLIESAISGPEGRDKQMLRILCSTELPLLHVVLAPGSDGESTHSALTDSFRQQMKQGSYLGCFQLDKMIPLINTVSHCLSSDRTPRIIVAGFENELETTENGFVVVPRGIQPTVPLAWLTHAFVFSHRCPDLGIRLRQGQK